MADLNTGEVIGAVTASLAVIAGAARLLMRSFKRDAVEDGLSAAHGHIIKQLREQVHEEHALRIKEAERADKERQAREHVLSEKSALMAEIAELKGTIARLQDRVEQMDAHVEYLCRLIDHLLIHGKDAQSIPMPPPDFLKKIGALHDRD